jgi:hypothetical protein
LCPFFNLKLFFLISKLDIMLPILKKVPQI